MLYMRAMVMLLILLPAMLLALAGCPHSVPQRSAEATYDAETAAARSGQGAEAAADAAQTPPSLPEEWPAEFPVYPDAVLTSCLPNAGGPQTGYTARLGTKEKGEKVLEFYRDKALAAGLKQQSYVVTEESGAAYFHGEKLDFTAGFDLAKDGTRVTLMYIPVVETPQVPTGSGLIPPNFPIDILPLYPGAEVLNAENMPMNNFIDMHSEDATLKEVLDFYMKYYKDMGLKIDKKEKTRKYMHYVFVSSTGGIVLDANLEPDKSVSIHLALARK